MHNLLRDMGREVIREKSPENIGQRSRLWLQDDVIDVLRRSTGTDEIKGLALKLTRTTKICLPAEGLKKMNTLRLLQLSHVELSGNYDGLFENLKWLCWLGFPSRLPSQNFYKETLVGIDLRHSNLKLFWTVPQFLHELKILNLSHSHHLKRTPYMPRLERLILKDCPRLSEIDETIGNLNNLRMVNLKGCESLQDLPRSFYMLKSLENLILSGCLKINKLEEDIEQMDSLTTLVADNTAITEVPRSIIRLKSINYISLHGYKGLAREVFPSLISSWISPISFWISPLNYLRSLSLAFGYKPRQASVDVQSNVFATKYLEMEATTSRPQLSLREGSELSVFQNQIPNSSRLDNMLCSLLIEMGNCRILQEWIANQSNDSSFPWHPEWPSYSNEGQRVSFKMSQVDCTLEGMILCIDSSQSGMASPFPFGILISNNTKGIFKFFQRDAETTTDEDQWQDVVANLEAGDEVDINVVFGQRFNAKKTTVYLIYRDSIKEQHSSTPDRDAVVS